MAQTIRAGNGRSDRPQGQFSPLRPGRGDFSVRGYAWSMDRSALRPACVSDWPESLIATHSGLRGRPGVDLTPRVVRRVIGAFVSMLRESGAAATIGVARDERPEGRALAA